MLLDLRLPGLSGLDLQCELRERGIEMPIVFVTGHGDIPMSVRAMKAGAMIPTKPFRNRICSTRSVDESASIVSIAQRMKRTSLRPSRLRLHLGNVR